MKRDKTILQYLTQVNQFDKFIAWMEEVKDIDQRWYSYDVEHRYAGNNSSSPKMNKNETFHIYISGSPICIAAFAGNHRVVDYLLRAKLNRAQAGKLVPEDPFQDYFDRGFEAHISFHIERETETTTSVWDKYFCGPEQIAFTLPLGRLECFKRFLKAGIHCDFHKREHLMLLAMCQERSFWEYLISHKYLDKSILLIAAGYAVYFKNKETAYWLLERYGLKDKWELIGGKR